ncbi:hypothetical protein [Actinoallomurus sp. NPDC050550]|uniref:hypothetical protein n=1 Tax=Actinoallomurus sp. NPDC050550 TaxID=3154937 RepID=UPI0033CFAD84
MIKALDQVAEVMGLGTAELGAEALVPARRLAELAKYGIRADASQIRRHPKGRRLATLLATVRFLEAKSVDDTLELLDLLTATERVLFGLVANRALAPSSKLAAANWITHDVHIDRLADADEPIAGDEHGRLEPHPDAGDRQWDDKRDVGFRMWDNPKDSREDLPQIVIGIAVTRDGIPVRYWSWPGDTSDQKLIRQVKERTPVPTTSRALQCPR